MGAEASIWSAIAQIDLVIGKLFAALTVYKMYYCCACAIILWVFCWYLFESRSTNKLYFKFTFFYWMGVGAA